jgi:hypothetical protein
MSVVRVIAGMVVSLLVAACDSTSQTSENTRLTSASVVSTTAATIVPSVMPLDPSGCPVDDAAVCATAIEVADAFAAGDAARLRELSRVDRIVCSDVRVEYFPGCATNDTLEGHGLSGPDLIVEVVDSERYLDWLTATTTAVGSGAVRVVGIGTCGPDQPGRRTYHVAWTAARRLDDRPAERMLGSFELTFDDDWRIALSYVGSLTDWQAAQPDPLHEAFCEAGRSPWRN